MKIAPVSSRSFARSGTIASTIVAIVALFSGAPAVAYEAPAAYESPASQTEYVAQYRPEALTSEHDGNLWTLALLGPAAVILVVTALGLTITVRSLRADVRRQFMLDHYWQRGARSRASAATHD